MGAVGEGSRVPLRRKLVVAHKAMRNWPLVAADRLGLVPMVRYKTRLGPTFECRSKTTDAGEVAVILSGEEYPAEFLRLPDEGVFFDLGGNIGAFSVYVGWLNRGRSHKGFAFEPSAENFAMMKRNIQSNGVSVEPVEAAVAGHDGTVSLTTGVKADRIAVSADDTGTIATSVRLSTFCHKRGIDRIDLMKLDVEGSEYDILEADLDFVNETVGSMILEYHRLEDGRFRPWLEERLTKFSCRVIDEKSDTGVMWCTRL